MLPLNRDSLLLLVMDTSLPDLVIRKRKRDHLALLAERKVKSILVRKSPLSKVVKNSILSLRRTVLKLKPKRLLNIVLSKMVNRNLLVASQLVQSLPLLSKAKSLKALLLRLKSLKALLLRLKSPKALLLRGKTLRDLLPRGKSLKALLLRIKSLRALDLSVLLLRMMVLRKIYPLKKVTSHLLQRTENCHLLQRKANSLLLPKKVKISNNLLLKNLLKRERRSTTDVARIAKMSLSLNLKKRSPNLKKKDPRESPESGTAKNGSQRKTVKASSGMTKKKRKSLPEIFLLPLEKHLENYLLNSQNSLSLFRELSMRTMSITLVRKMETLVDAVRNTPLATEMWKSLVSLRLE